MSGNYSLDRIIQHFQVISSSLLDVLRMLESDSVQLINDIKRELARSDANPEDFAD